MDKPSSEPVVDSPSQAACEAAKVAAVLVGFGLLPALRERFAQTLWLACLAGGLLALAAGLLRAWRLRPARLLPAGWTGLTVQFQTALVGLLLLVAAAAAFALRSLPGLEPGLLLLFLATPVILAWISAEVQFSRPLLNTRPKHAPELIALLAHGLQIVGGLALWSYLGLSVGSAHLGWLGLAAALLSGAGALLAIASGISSEAGAPAATRQTQAAAADGKSQA